MVGEEGERAEFYLQLNCFQVRITLRVRFLKRIADKNCDPSPSITSVCLYMSVYSWDSVATAESYHIYEGISPIQQTKGKWREKCILVIQEEWVQFSWPNPFNIREKLK